MADVAERIVAALKTRLNAESVEIADESAGHAGHAGAMRGGGHYRVTVVSGEFAGKSRVERHRMVYEALESEMGAAIHALALRTLAPDERA
ncbi:BolA family transcriptional regulator [bacterium]|nr:BolA family transcriptional regulator [bacterium]